MSANNKKKFKFTYNRYQWWRIINILTFGALVAAFMGTSLFLYSYIFRRLEDAHTIVMLSADEQIDTINLNVYQKAVSLIALKVSTTPFVFPLRNVFLLPPTSTSAVNTSTLPQ